MLNSEQKTAVWGTILLGGAILGAAVGEPVSAATVSGIVVAEIMKNLGANLAANNLGPILDDWAKDGTNHDIAKAVKASFQKAMKIVQEEWDNSPHKTSLSKNEQRVIQNLFNHLQNIEIELSQIYENQEIQQFLGNPHPENFGNWLEQKGYPRDFCQFVAQRLPKQQALFFGEQLKDNPRAWVAYQRLFLEGLAVGQLDLKTAINRLETDLQQGLFAIEAKLNRMEVKFDSMAAQIDSVLQKLAYVSEDGRISSHDHSLPIPCESFEGTWLEELDDPTGSVKLRSKFYIERADADQPLKQQIIHQGSITTVRAPRQGGKSSLLARGLHHAKERGYTIVRVDLQEVDTATYHVKESFLRYLSECMTRKLRLDRQILESAWQGSQNSQDKFSFFIEDYILPQLKTPLVLMLDEIDRLFDTNFYGDFFALMRAWHNKAASDELWEKLNIVLVISTEPHLLIPNLNQSPFNVGLRIYLKDFNEAQVADLNQRHGGPVSDRDLPDVMRWLSGHPYLTRRALYTLVMGHLTWPQLRDQAMAEEGPFADHLKYHYRLVQDRAELRAALQQIMRKQLPDEAILHRLNKAGLVKGIGSDYTLRCELYHRYFELKWR